MKQMKILIKYFTLNYKKFMKPFTLERKKNGRNKRTQGKPL